MQDNPNTNSKTVLTRKQSIKQFIKFALFSASAGLIQVGTFTLLNELIGWSYWPCYLIALVLSVLWNFTFNRRFTFKSAANVPIAMLKVAAYYAVFTPISTLWGDALDKAGLNEYIILAGTMVINLITEFLFCKFVVYRNDINTRQDKKKVVEGEETDTASKLIDAEDASEISWVSFSGESEGNTLLREEESRISDSEDE